MVAVVPQPANNEAQRMEAIGRFTMAFLSVGGRTAHGPNPPGTPAVQKTYSSRQDAERLARALVELVGSRDASRHRLRAPRQVAAPSRGLWARKLGGKLSRWPGRWRSGQRQPGSSRPCGARPPAR